MNVLPLSITPFNENKVSLYDGQQWKTLNAPSGIVRMVEFKPNTNYDLAQLPDGEYVFSEWTSDTTRMATVYKNTENQWIVDLGEKGKGQYWGTLRTSALR